MLRRTARGFGRSIARIARSRDKAAQLRVRARQSQRTFMERHQARATWYAKTFRAPMIGLAWLFKQASSLWMAMLAILGMRSTGKTIRLEGRRGAIKKSKQRSKFRGLMHEPLESRQLLAADLFVNDNWASEGQSGVTQVEGTISWIWTDADNDNVFDEDEVIITKYGDEEINVTKAYATIQNAIEDATEKQSIAVAPGKYTGSVQVNVKDLSILGANAGISVGSLEEDEIPIARSEESTLTGGFSISASGVNVDGFEVKQGVSNGGERVAFDLTSIADQAIIQNNIITGPASEDQERGIVVGANGTQILNNSITEWKNSGIYIISSSGHNIRGNLIDGASAGIGSDGLSNTTIAENKFSGNSLEAIGGSSIGNGVAITGNEYLASNGATFNHYGGAPVSSSGNIFYLPAGITTEGLQNAINNAEADAAIVIPEGEYEQISVNSKSLKLIGKGNVVISAVIGSDDVALTVTNSIVTVQNITFIGDDNAIDVSSTSKLVVDGSSLIQSRSDAAIRLRTNSIASIKNSKISGFDVAIQLLGDATATVLGSTLETSSESGIGISIGTSATATLHNNDLSYFYQSSSREAVVNNNPNKVVDASRNFWGAINVSAVLEEILGRVDISPFWGSSPVTNSADILYVTRLGEHVGEVERIQEAIDAVPANGTVNVGAGTFEENVVITKSLTLLGANAQSGSASEVVGVGERGAETIILGVSNLVKATEGVAGKSNAVIQIDIADGSANSGVVTIDGFTIDGFNENSDEGDSFQLIDGSGRTNTTIGIANMNAWGLSGTSVNKLIVQNNIIENVQIGVFAQGKSTSPDSKISNNTFKNIGTTTDDDTEPFGFGVTLRNGFYADVIANKMESVFVGVHAHNMESNGVSTDSRSTWQFANNEIESLGSGILVTDVKATAIPIAVKDNVLTYAELPAGIVPTDTSNVGVLFSGVKSNDTYAADNDINGFEYGIVVTNGLVSISGGKIEDSKIGVWGIDGVGTLKFTGLHTAAHGTGSTSVTVSGTEIKTLGQEVGSRGILIDDAEAILSAVTVDGGGIGIEVTGDEDFTLQGLGEGEEALKSSISRSKIVGLFIHNRPSDATLNEISGTAFSNNGISGDPGTADVSFWNFNGDASLTDLTLIGSGAHSGIQFRGAGVKDATDDTGLQDAGTIVLKGIDISGKYKIQMLGFQHYADMGGVATFEDVQLGGSNSELYGDWGASLRFDAVGTDTIEASVSSVDLGNTEFRGLKGDSKQKHEIDIAPDNLNSFVRINATNTTWGSITAGNELANSNAFEIENRIVHFVDKLHPLHGETKGAFKGFVEIKAENVYITSREDNGVIGNGSIQRGIEIAPDEGTVNVGAGTFEENSILINKTLKLFGAQSGVDPANGRDLDSKLEEETTISVQGADKAGFVVAADDVEINGFNIQGNGEASQGIEGVAHDGLNVSHNFIHDFKNIAVAFQRDTTNGVVKHNAIFNSWAGVYLSIGSEGHKISNNTFYENFGGLDTAPEGDITLEPSVSDVVIQNNTFNSDISGVYLFGGDGYYSAIEIAENAFLGERGVSNMHANTVDASNNWWGSEYGPTNELNPYSVEDEFVLGARVDGPVEFGPWLTDGIDKLAIVSGFQITIEPPKEIAAPTGVALDSDSDSLASGTLPAGFDSTNNDRLTNSKSPTFIGEATEGDLIKLYQSNDEAADLLVGWTIAGADGWEIVVAQDVIHSGTYSFYATATQLNGNTSVGSDALEVTFDFDAPEPASITVLTTDSGDGTEGSDSDGITNEDSPTFTGTAVAGTLVRLYRKEDDSAILLGQAIADEESKWTITVGEALEDGRYSIWATSTDVSGNNSDDSDLYVFQIDTSDPVIEVESDWGSVVYEGETYSLPTDPPVNDESSYSRAWYLSDSLIETTTGFTAPNGPDSLIYTYVVTDLAGNTSSAYYMVTFKDKSPSIVISGSTTVAEGSTYSLSLESYSDHDDDSALKFKVLWGDGTSTIYKADATVEGDEHIWNSSTPATHVYANESGANPYSITVWVLDDQGWHSGIEEAGVANELKVTVTNTAPVVSNIKLSAISVLEGGKVALTGDIFDAGGGDKYKLSVTWGDGNTITYGTSEVPLTVTDGKFSVEYTYADDNPTGSAVDVNLITFTLSDVNDAESKFYGTAGTVFVSNVAPVLNDISATSSGKTVTLGGSLVDPGNDGFTLSINWGDGTVSTIAIPASEEVLDGEVRDISDLVEEGKLTHTYAQFGNYAISITVVDDDGGYGFAAVSANVVNTAIIAKTLDFSGPWDNAIPANGTIPIVFRNDAPEGAPSNVIPVGSLVSSGTPSVEHLKFSNFEGELLQVSINGILAQAAADKPYFELEELGISYAYNSDSDTGTLLFDPGTATKDVLSKLPVGQTALVRIRFSIGDGTGSDVGSVIFKVAGAYVPATTSPANPLIASNDAFVTNSRAMRLIDLLSNDSEDALLQSITVEGKTYSVTEDGTKISDGTSEFTEVTTSAGILIYVGREQENFYFLPNSNSSGVLNFNYSIQSNGSTSSAQAMIIVQQSSNEIVNLFISENLSPGSAVLVDGSDIDSIVDINDIIDKLRPVGSSFSNPVEIQIVGDVPFEISSEGKLVSKQQLNFELLQKYEFKIRGYWGNEAGDKRAQREIDVIVNLVDDTSEAGPRVTEVRLNSTAWTTGFRNYVNGSFYDGKAVGYAIPTGVDQQDRILPWVGINQIQIQFSDDVSESIDVSDLTLVGRGGVNRNGQIEAIPGVISVTYDRTSNIATFELDRSLDASVVEIKLNAAGIMDVDGNALDGEWIDNVSEFGGDNDSTSGDGVAGGDFLFTLNVLPGSVRLPATTNSPTPSNEFTVLDAHRELIEQAQGASLAFGQPAGGYVSELDLNGDGKIDSKDARIIQGRVDSRII